jgi:hypothetical protein
MRTLLLPPLLLACQQGPVRPVRVQIAAPRNPAVEVAVQGAWDLDFGRDPYAPLGPLAVFSDTEGYALLDQEGLAIRRYNEDGQPLAVVPIRSRSTADALARGTGGFELLTYHRAETPAWTVDGLSATGDSLTSWPVPSEALVPTGVFLNDGDLGDGDVLVEHEHDTMFDVRTGLAVPGRPDGSGLYVKGERSGPRRATLTWRDQDFGAVARVHLDLDRPLQGIVSLDPRPEGVLVGLFCFAEGPAPGFEMIRPELRVVLVDRDGVVSDEVSLPLGIDTDVHRPLAWSRGGNLVSLQTDDNGMGIGLVRLP